MYQSGVLYLSKETIDHHSKGASIIKDHLTEFNQQPSTDEIRSLLGASYPLWVRLTCFIETSYQIKGKWSSWGPANFGWGFRYRRKGRALVALYPQRDRFIAQIVLGIAQADRAFNLDLGEEISVLLKESPQLRDGRWLSIPVVSETDARDVEQLLLVKMKLIN